MGVLHNCQRSTRQRPEASADFGAYGTIGDTLGDDDYISMMMRRPDTTSKAAQNVILGDVVRLREFHGLEYDSPCGSKSQANIGGTAVAAMFAVQVAEMSSQVVT